jgi:hypothetical protein
VRAFAGTLLRLPRPISFASLYIEDDTTTGLLAEIAEKRGVTKQDAVRLAIENERAPLRVPRRRIRRVDRG